MRILLIVAALTFLVSPSTAQHPPAPKNVPVALSATGEEVSQILFDVVELIAIEEFYGHLPEGLTKQGLPIDLNNELPPANQGMERANAGIDVVLIHQAKGEVLDILKDKVLK
jgi:hypothetical protein